MLKVSSMLSMSSILLISGLILLSSYRDWCFDPAQGAGIPNILRIYFGPPQTALTIRFP